MQVLLYDEPTAGLDPVASTVVEDLMRSLHDPKNNNDGLDISSYIVVTHQHSTIKRAVDRLIFLHDGVVAWEGQSLYRGTHAEKGLCGFEVRQPNLNRQRNQLYDNLQPAAWMDRYNICNVILNRGSISQSDL